jgi:hypothetical protein
MDQTTSTGSPPTTGVTRPPVATTPPPRTPTTGAPSPWEPPTVCEEPCDPPLEILFTVPVGDDGVGYADVDREEMLGWGPSALTVDEAGTVWIVDQVHNRLLAFSRDGAPLATIDLTNYGVASVADIAPALPASCCSTSTSRLAGIACSSSTREAR